MILRLISTCRFFTQFVLAHFGFSFRIAFICLFICLLCLLCLLWLFTWLAALLISTCRFLILAFITLGISLWLFRLHILVPWPFTHIPSRLGSCIHLLVLHILQVWFTWSSGFNLLTPTFTFVWLFLALWWFPSSNPAFVCTHSGPASCVSLWLHFHSGLLSRSTFRHFTFIFLGCSSLLPLSGFGFSHCWHFLRVHLITLGTTNLSFRASLPLSVGRVFLSLWLFHIISGLCGRYFGVSPIDLL